MRKNVATNLVGNRESGEAKLKQIERRSRPMALRDLMRGIDAEVAEGIAAEERGELHEGEEAMAEIRAELELRGSEE